MTGSILDTQHEPGDGAATGLRVLVVEDHPESARSLALLLGMCGHDVEVALDGPAALDLARNTQPDVVVLDLALPGMDGWTVARQLTAQATEKRPFFIVVSGHGSDDDLRQSEAAGIDVHLVKPIDPQYLEAILRRFRQVIH